ncbi:hypothetical protein ACFQ0O_18590 [Saccharopolyspora spinosporotrichia]
MRPEGDHRDDAPFGLQVAHGLRQPAAARHDPVYLEPFPELAADAGDGHGADPARRVDERLGQRVELRGDACDGDRFGVVQEHHDGAAAPALLPCGVADVGRQRCFAVGQRHRRPGAVALALAGVGGVDELVGALDERGDVGAGVDAENGVDDVTSGAQHRRVEDHRVDAVQPAQRVGVEHEISPVRQGARDLRGERLASRRARAGHARCEGGQRALGEPGDREHRAVAAEGERTRGVGDAFHRAVGQRYRTRCDLDRCAAVRARGGVLLPPPPRLAAGQVLARGAQPLAGVGEQAERPLGQCLRCQAGRGQRGVQERAAHGLLGRGSHPRHAADQREGDRNQRGQGPHRQHGRGHRVTESRDAEADRADLAQQERGVTGVFDALGRAAVEVVALLEVGYGVGELVRGDRFGVVGDRDAAEDPVDFRGPDAGHVLQQYFQLSREGFGARTVQSPDVEVRPVLRGEHPPPGRRGDHGADGVPHRAREL